VTKNVKNVQLNLSSYAGCANKGSANTALSLLVSTYCGFADRVVFTTITQIQMTQNPVNQSELKANTSN